MNHVSPRMSDACARTRPPVGAQGGGGENPGAIARCQVRGEERASISPDSAGKAVPAEGFELPPLRLRSVPKDTT